MSSSHHIQRNALALQALANANASLRQSMIVSAKRSLVMALVKVAQDIIKGKVRLTPYQLKRMRPFEQLLKNFISKKSNLNSKKKILQTGGFLGILLKPLMSLIPSVLGAITGPRR